MLRALLWGALAVSAVAACGSKDDAAATAPGAVAGKVVEAKGAVRVGAKPLAKGDTITVDDVIETGADGSVVILLSHNDARWSLGPNRKVKATDSAAWTAEKGTGGATDQDTAAAGRPAEKSAADTSTSSRGMIGEAKEAPAAEAPQAPQAAAAPAPTAQPTPPPAPGPSHGAAAGGGGPPPQTKATKGGASAAPPPAPPPPPPPPQVEKPRADAMAAAGASEGGLIDTSTLSACLVTGTKVKLSLHIKAHVPTIRFLSAADAKTKACITTAAKALAKHVESGDMQLELTKQ